MKIEPMPEGTGALIARMAADDRKATSALPAPEPAGPAGSLAVATGSAISVDDIQNGTVWEAKWPQCWTVVVQWLSGDRYLLLSAPEPAIHGGTCQVTHIRNDGKEIRTREETREALEKWGAKRMNASLSLQNK